MLTVHISKHIISADGDSCLKLYRAIATGYYLKADVLSYYNA